MVAAGFIIFFADHVMSKSTLTPEKLARMQALVVEDNKFMRGIISDLLRQIGFERIQTAENGEEGIQQFCQWMPHVVFSDWNMPKMSGVEMTKWIRTSEESPNPETPVILITGNNQQKDVIAARNAGVTEFISKPVTTALIMHRLNSAFLDPRKFVRARQYTGPCRRRRWGHDYKGALRRLDDPFDAAAEEMEEAKLKLDVVSKEIYALNEMARNLDVADRRQVREVRDKTLETRERAESANDEKLVGAADSLTTYIDAFGAAGDMEKEVVFMHLSAMNRLVEIAGQQDSLRQKVVDGLQAVVRKRMRRGPSAA